MNRQEAIEILRGLKPTNTVSITDAYNTGKALTMAISSLETDEAYQLEYEQPEFCADCISREWIKTAIHNFFQGLIHRVTEEDIQRYLDVAPSVYPKSDKPSGKWIPVTKDRNIWQCSICGNGVCISEDYLKIHHKYCGQCGNKMESEDKE